MMLNKQAHQSQERKGNQGEVRPVGRPGVANLGGLHYLESATTKTEKKVYIKLQVYTNLQIPFPVFVIRRSFRAVGESCVTNLIPDPKPIRTSPQGIDPCPLNLVTLLEPAVVALLWAEGVLSRKACVSTKQWRRGLAMSKGEGNAV